MQIDLINQSYNSISMGVIALILSRRNDISRTNQIILQSGQENVEIGDHIAMGSGYIYSNSNLNTLFYTPINIDRSLNQTTKNMTPYNLTSNPTQVPFLFLNDNNELFCEV